MLSIKSFTAAALVPLLLFCQRGQAQIASPAMLQDEYIKISGITSDNQIYPLTVSQKQTTRVFYDGFGRPIQNVDVATSPLGKDIVTYGTYGIVGSNGPQITKYLPYVGADGAGEYHPAAATEQTAYYNNGLSDKVTDDADPWAQLLGEASPLQRTMYVGSAGNGFQPSPGNGSQHYKTIVSRTNNSSAYVNDNTGIRIWLYSGTSAGVYPTGSLAVTEFTDEAGNVSALYKDVNGRVVLKRQIITAKVIDGSTENCLDTYYIYDDASELRFVIPPKTVARLRNLNANPWDISSATASRYQYDYDAHGRLYHKILASGTDAYIIYDPMNRPVLMQTGVLRGSNNNGYQWFYFKYDSKGRVISTGLYVDAVNGTSASAMQNYVNGLNYSTSYYEDRQAGTSPNFYTNRVFPTTNQDGSALKALTYNYFDDYDLNQDGNPDYAYTVQGITGEEPSTPLTKGKSTVVFKRTLNNDISLDVWLQTVRFYDKYGYVIQTLSSNQTNATSITDSRTIAFDFTGKPNVAKTARTVASAITNALTTVGYDNVGRLATLDQSNNGGGTVRIAQYIYNELGVLVNKKLHSTDDVNFFQNVDFRYNIRMMLTSINNSTLSVDGTNYTNSDANDLFGEEILYEKTDAAIGNTAYYNGNISAVKWESQSTANNNQRSYVYSYDKVNRLVGAHYQDRTYQSSGAWGNGGYNDETVSAYDLNGNIMNLQRNQSGTQIDNLTYSYTGNQLNNVSDAGTTAGFNGTNTSAYSYDNNGNLVTDPKKGITIAYNIFNKTDKITFTGGNNIRYTYDATGTLIRKETNTSGTVVVYDYIGGYVYINQALSYFATAEGRVRNSSGALIFEYFIRDHLGNVRVSFDGTGSSAVLRQENSYYPFGMLLPGNYTPTAPNTHLFNGGADWQNDYALNMPDLYQTAFRNYDAELGRFIGVDPSAGRDESFSPYHFADDNPVSHNDPMGNVVPANPPGCNGDCMPSAYVVAYRSNNLPPLGDGGISAPGDYAIGPLSLLFGGGSPWGGASGGNGSSAPGYGPTFDYNSAGDGNYGNGGIHGGGGGGSTSQRTGGGGQTPVGGRAGGNFHYQAPIPGDNTDLDQNYHGNEDLLQAFMHVGGEDFSRAALIGAYSTGSVAGEGDAQKLLWTFINGEANSTDVTTIMFGTGSTISQHIAKSPAFQTFAADFVEAFKANLDGNNPGFDGDEFLDQNHPDLRSDIYLHTVMGGYQYIEVNISVTSDQITFEYIFTDHFGAGVGDSGVWYLPGLPNMYYLQHNLGDETQYTPFKWSTMVQVVVPR